MPYWEYHIILEDWAEEIKEQRKQDKKRSEEEAKEKARTESMIKRKQTVTKPPKF